MTKIPRLVLVVVLAATVLSAPPLAIQDPPVVRVPEGNGRPILVDSVFTPEELDDALRIDVRPGVQLLLKKAAGFRFVGIRHASFTLTVVDLFISPDGQSVRQLHVSAQLGERFLAGIAHASEDCPPFVWGDTAGWYANEIRWNERKLQALVKERKSAGEAQAASLCKYDGFEFQIRRSKFGSGRWLVRLETWMPPDWSKPVIYPEGADVASTRRWLMLALD